MIEKLKFKGHVIDSLVLSKLLDIITELDVVCHVSDVKLGKRREESSEAIFIIETDDKTKMNNAIEIAKKHGAQVI